MLSVLGGISRARVPLKNIANCVVHSKQSTNMSNKKLSLYEEAVYALNGLQSNAATLLKSYAGKEVSAIKKLAEVGEHLKILGIEVSDLDSLNIIHVAGTKGKGSTCAFVESILRSHNFKTGFYSSPHLVSVNERIRINGVPIDKNLFVKYFWEVYNPLQQNLRNGTTMPPYFMFLTVMAFYIFVKEQVEAAVIEVGIGGLYDCTNIIRKPVVVGISSLGIDHVKLLGSTLPLIAQQKAGILKPGVPAFTVPQHESAMKVLYEKAKEVNCPLKIAPPLEIYDQNLKLGIPGDVQAINASLALQLASTWLETHSSRDLGAVIKSVAQEYKHSNESMFIPMATSFHLDSKFKKGLESCVWPGRFQIIEKKGVTLYLDGAHTKQSLIHCAKWFEEASKIEKNKLQVPALRVLLFNCTGMRNVESLLDPLSDMNFDLVIFSPNRKTVMKDSSSDQSNFTIDPEEEIRQCMLNKEIWGHMIRSINENASNNSQASPVIVQYDVKSSLLEDNSVLFCCLSNAVDWLIYKKHIKHCLCCDKSEVFLDLLNEAAHIQVLVTGSLHLVGGVIALIDS